MIVSRGASQLGTAWQITCYISRLARFRETATCKDKGRFLCKQLYSSVRWFVTAWATNRKHTHTSMYTTPISHVPSYTHVHAHTQTHTHAHTQREIATSTSIQAANSSILNFTMPPNQNTLPRQPSVQPPLRATGNRISSLFVGNCT